MRRILLAIFSLSLFSCQFLCAPREEPPAEDKDDGSTGGCGGGTSLRLIGTNPQDGERGVSIHTELEVEFGGVPDCTLTPTFLIEGGGTEREFYSRCRTNQKWFSETYSFYTNPVGHLRSDETYNIRFNTGGRLVSVDDEPFESVVSWSFTTKSRRETEIEEACWQIPDYEEDTICDYVSSVFVAETFSVANSYSDCFNDEDCVLVDTSINCTVTGEVSGCKISVASGNVEHYLDDLQSSFMTQIGEDRWGCYCVSYCSNNPSCQTLEPYCRDGRCDKRVP